MTFTAGCTTNAQVQAAFASGATVSVKLTDAAGNSSTSTASNPAITVDYTAPSAPTSVAFTPVGGTVVANTLNTTNTNFTASAAITAGQATGGQAELLKGGASFTTPIKDTSIAAGDTTVTFTAGCTTNAQVQAAFASGATVSVKLTDAAGNSSTSTASNPAITVDYTAPQVSTVVVATGLTVDVTFSEAMGTGVTTAGNYTVSGTGKGTLANNPNSVAQKTGNTYTLTWTAGEMKQGGDITITVANAQDLAGNPIGTPNSGTHTNGGIGTAPASWANFTPTDWQTTQTPDCTIQVSDADSGLRITGRESEADSDTVGLWHFNEGHGTSAVDSSGEGNNGIFYGETFKDGTIEGATWTTGKRGRALGFDGEDDYVSIPDLSAFVDKNEGTIEFWMRTDEAQANGREVLVFSGARPNFVLDNNTRLGLQWSGSTGMTYSEQYGGFCFLTYGAWAHIALTWSASGTAYAMYMDGVLKDSDSTCVLSALTTGTEYLGSYTTPSNYFKGAIDEVRVWNKALTQEEIQAEMNSSRPVRGDGLVAAWGFEEGSGTTLGDSHNWVKGKFGSALNFDGLNDYVKVLDNDDLDLTGDYTIECWTSFDVVGNPSARMHAIEKWRYVSSTNLNGYSLRKETNSAVVYFYHA